MLCHAARILSLARVAESGKSGQLSQNILGNECPDFSGVSYNGLTEIQYTGM